MRKYYLIVMLTLCSLLTACYQTTGQHSTNEGFFNSFPSMSSDETITTSVNNAFMGHPDLAELPIQIETRKGTVYLSGYVKTIRQSDTAGDVALKTPGVKALHNGLIVRK